MTNGDVEMYSILVEAHTGSVFQMTVPGEQSTTTILVSNLSKSISLLILQADIANI